MRLQLSTMVRPRHVCLLGAVLLLAVTLPAQVAFAADAAEDDELGPRVKHDVAEKEIVEAAQVRHGYNGRACRTVSRLA